jgi:hypothetical protein
MARRRARKPAASTRAGADSRPRRRARYSPTELFMAGVGAFVLVVIAVVVILAIFGGH